MASSERGDAAFFLQLSELNLARGDLQAAVTCLESAAERRPDPAERARLGAVAARASAGASDEIASRLRAAVERASSSDETPAAPAPADSPAPPPDARTNRRASSEALETVRRLLVSPELIARLRDLIGERARADERPDADTTRPLGLPAAEVLARLLDADLDLHQTARIALDLVIAATGAARGYLVLADRGHTSVASDDAADARPPAASEGILSEVERTRRTVVLADAQQDDRFAARDSVQELGLRAVLCVPILAGAELVGAVYLDAPRAPGRFGPPERELAETLAALIGQPLLAARRFADARRELAATRRRLVGSSEHPGSAARREGPVLIGRSSAMRRLEAAIERVADSEQTILITGESGSGKELVARALHARSRRAGGPLVAENVSALAEGLLEAELFGHEKGAFTGASEARAGLFQLADGGTLFLDEVGDVPPAGQRALLRVLEEREVRPVGGGRSVRVDVRVIAATHRDLLALVREGTFREDLYYRLSVVPVRVPPLRERLEDIGPLLEHFVAVAAAESGRPAPAIDRALIARMREHAWPGNVRELAAYATRLVLDGPSAELAADERSHARVTGPIDIEVRLPEPGADADAPTLRSARAEFDRAYVGLVLKRCEGKVSAAAKVLGMNRTYLSELLKRLGLRTP